MNKRAIVYSRVSSDEQTQGYSLQTQVEGCISYANQNKLEVVKVFEENYTGATLERPQFYKAREMLQSGEANAVIVYHLDLLSRDLVDLLVICRDWLRAGISLYALDIGLIESELDIVLVIKGWQGSDERQKIRERTTRGRKAKARHGKWVGTGDPPYGYRRKGTRKDVELVIDEFDSKIVNRIFQDYIGANGSDPKNLQQIVRELTRDGIKPPGNGNGWYRTSLYRIITNRIYIGEYVYSGETVKIPEVKIVDRKLWGAAQKQRQKNKVFSKRNRQHEYLLSSMLFCKCGLRVCSKSMQRGKYLYYECGSKSFKNHLSTCNARYVRADIADDMVWNWLLDLLLDEERLRKGLHEYAERRDDELKPKRDRLATIEDLIRINKRKLNNLTDDLGEFTGTAKEAVKEKIKEISYILDNLRVERDLLNLDIESREIAEEDAKSIMAQAVDIRRRLTNDPSYEQKRSLLKLLDFKAGLRKNGEGRWLDVSCGLKIDADCLPLDGQAYSIVLHPC